MTWTAPRNGGYSAVPKTEPKPAPVRIPPKTPASASQRARDLEAGWCDHGPFEVCRCLYLDEGGN